MNIKTRRAFLACCLLLFSVACAADTVTVTRVIDGDSLVVFDGDSEIVVRLIGVDTPESRNSPKAKRDAEQWGVPVEEILEAGREASAFTASICPPGIAVTLPAADRKRDLYGRFLAYVILPDGRCINEVLVRMGYATVYRQEKFERKADYVEAERVAMGRNRKFWKSIWRNAK